MRKLEAEYARLSRFPSRDVFTNGTVMTWSRRFDTDVNYNYAAIRANDFWWTTGVVARGQRSLNYDDLLTFIGDGTNVRIIDPDVGVELDELVIEEGDDGRPWRNRVKEARNAVSNELAEEFTSSARKHTPGHGYAGGDCTDECVATSDHVDAVRAREVPVTAADDGWVQPPTARELLDGEPVRRPRTAGDLPQ